MKETMPGMPDPDLGNLILEAMAEGVFVLDDKGVITFWNRSMERITGYGAEEAIGASCAILKFNRCFGKSCPAGPGECDIFKYERIDGKECFLLDKEGNHVPVVKSARIVKDKNGEVKGVVETVTDLTELHKARHEAEEANRRLGEVYCFDNIIGKSDLMQQVFASIKAAATSESTVLIQGESGTGKELVAGAIHYNSSRREEPFVTVNCSALSESLLESELFGHSKGSFTGAVRNRKGRFEEAQGGTLFLDEIGELSPFIQVKLLRVLQEREVERVGESKKRKLDIRVITATNRELYKLVQEGGFREDLYYRLKVFPVSIPPLRERKEDVPLLISHFIDGQNIKTGKRIAGVSRSVMRLLLDYNWPGNVRELENTIEHAFVLCNVEYIDLFDLPVEIRKMEYPSVSTGLPSANERGSAFDATSRKKLTREYLLEVLEASDWNKAEVGRRLGVSRAAVWKYMKKWDIPMQRC